MSVVKVMPNQCTMCDVPPEPMEVDEEAFARWQAGELIQRAFPNLSAGDRELLMTGIHPKCWDKLFGED